MTTRSTSRSREGIMANVMTWGEALVYALSVTILFTALVAIVWSLIGDILKGEDKDGMD
jgi:hypothetical protein